MFTFVNMAILKIQIKQLKSNIIIILQETKGPLKTSPPKKNLTKRGMAFTVFTGMS